MLFWFVDCYCFFVLFCFCFFCPSRAAAYGGGFLHSQSWPSRSFLKCDTKAKPLGELSCRFTWTCCWKPGSSSRDMEIQSTAGCCVVLSSTLLLLLLLWCDTPLTFSSLTFFVQDISGPPAVVRLVCAAKENRPQKNRE